MLAALAWCMDVEMGDESIDVGEEAMDIQVDKTWASVKQDLFEEMGQTDTMYVTKIWTLICIKSFMFCEAFG